MRLALKQTNSSAIPGTAIPGTASPGGQAIPATAAICGPLFRAQAGGELYLWESAALSIWCLLTDSPLQKRVPASWVTVSRRVWRSLLPGAGADAFCCSRATAERLEFAAGQRRELLDAQPITATQRDWLYFWANTWDASSWNEVGLDVTGGWTLPEWWLSIREAADLDRDENLSAERVVDYLLRDVVGMVEKLPRNLPAPADVDWLDLVDKLGRYATLTERFDEELESAKLEALKEFAYGASHEINNPLANIAGRAQNLFAEETHPEKKRALATIAAEAFRAHDMIGDIMLVARPPRLSKTKVDLPKLLAEIAQGRRERVTMANVSIDVEQQHVDAQHVDAQHVDAQHVAQQRSTEGRSAVGTGSESLFEVLVDKTHIRESIELLIDNSHDAIGKAGAIRLQWIVLDFGGIDIVVQDDGAGVPDSVRPHIFEPYFSGREAGRGLGIGLSKCWVIAQAHGGSISCQSSPGCTRFTLHLPRSDEEPGDE